MARKRDRDDAYRNKQRLAAAKKKADEAAEKAAQSPGCDQLQVGGYANGGIVMTGNTFPGVWYMNGTISLSPQEPVSLPVEAEATAIVGFRKWPITLSFPEGYRIAALNTTFDGRVSPCERLEAECKASNVTYYWAYGLFQTTGTAAKVEHEAPGQNCTCGIHAYKTSVPLEPSDEPYAVGEVYLWGRVIEHADGYRAQFAYPKRLFVVDGGPRAQHVAVALGLAYGVPCEVWDG